MLVALFALLPLFGQDVEVPDFGSVFLTYLTVAGATTFLAEAVIRLLSLVHKAWKVAFVILIAVGLSFLSNLINVGYLAEATWWETLLWGGLSAATASGLRSQNLLFIKTIVDFLIGYIKSKEPVE